ncbi:alpha/beta fold hydrolase [Terasakiella pusilla]|uniref:alpha/beta fold hydrolase n=1 Tax=Terasakiella pusilla TaxID=64973 RepID=UPI003AA88AC0
MLNTLKALLVLLTLTACTPHIEGLGKRTQVPDLDGDTFYVAQDGVRLPLRIWEPKEPAKAVLIGVHGFNDYGNFLTPGMETFLQDNAIKLITYDQRGFGKSATRGFWPGKEALVNDLANIIHLVHSRYEHLPLYVMGESMGGAVVVNTLTQVKPLPIEGAILSAPAVWGPSSWPWYQKATLYAMSYTMPWLTLSGGGIVQPTDHLENWKNWSLDPLVIRNTRVDAMWGVSWLMEDALNAAPDLDVPTLMLYGANDEVIPHKPTAQFVKKLPANVKVAYYPDGWHWLSRDHNGPTIWKDVVSWINTPTQSLTSGADQDARENF